MYRIQLDNNPASHHTYDFTASNRRSILHNFRQASRPDHVASFAQLNLSKTVTTINELYRPVNKFVQNATGGKRHPRSPIVRVRVTPSLS